MKTQLSALMDGELEVHETAPLVAKLARDERLQTQWDTYHLIGDALRQEGNLHLDLSARVLTALHNEPTVLAPTARASERLPAVGQGRRLMALAASLAGVSVVGWLAMAQLPGQAPEKLATVVLDAKSVKPVATPASANMQEYLVAHQTHSLSGQMQSGTLYIRTVSAER
jgi:sigma-E factor negative regulatory protein RseA